jgi:predicted outer membrane repeat protein
VYSVFRNEAQGIAEFVLHYFAEGASQLVLIDNLSTDGGGAIAAQLGATVVRTAGEEPSRDPVCKANALAALTCRHRQNAIYHAHVHLMRTTWVLVVDIDEFVYARRGFPTIAAFAATRPANVGAIILPWKPFAPPPEDAQPLSRIEASTRRCDAKVSGLSFCEKTLWRREHLFSNASFSVHGATVRSRTVYSRHQPGKDLGRTGKCWRIRWGALKNHSVHSQAARDKDCLHLNHYSPSLDYWRRIKLARANGFHKRALSEETWFQQNASFTTCELPHTDRELYAKRGSRFYEQLPTRRMSNGELWP